MSQHETLFNRVRTVNWKNPINILIAVVIPFTMFTLGSLFNTGFVLGVFMAISALTLYSKLPGWIKRLCHKFPLVTDIAFTGVATAGVAALFGTGLTLGIAAIVCDLVLTWAMPRMA